MARAIFDALPGQSEWGYDSDTGAVAQERDFADRLAHAALSALRSNQPEGEQRTWSTLGCLLCGQTARLGAEAVTCAGVLAWGTAHDPQPMVPVTVTESLPSPEPTEAQVERALSSAAVRQASSASSRCRAWLADRADWRDVIRAALAAAHQPEPEEGE